MNLEGKRALVTGGSVRIGKAISEALTAEGTEVIVHFRKSKPDGLKSVQADLDDPAQCDALINRVTEEFGPIDILVNNAAVFHACSLDESSHDAVQRELQPNLFAPLTLTRVFARQKRNGKIINLLDRRITTYDTGYIPYMLSKKGLEELTNLSALELAPHITVNAIAPGAVLPPPDEEGDTAREPAGIIPLDRRPGPQDIAAAALYLLKSDVITGQTLFIDSGQHLTG